MVSLLATQWYGNALRDAVKGGRLLRANGDAALFSNEMTLVPFALRLSKGALLFVALLASVPYPAIAQPTPTAVAPVTVRASVDHNQITIGDPIRYTVEVSAATDTEIVIPVLSGTIGDFTISDFGELPPRKENGRAVVSRWYTLTTFATGDLLIPAPKVHYRLPGEALQEAHGDEVLVGVTSLLAKDPKATDIRDIKPPQQLPFDWRPYGIAAAAVVVVGLLGAAFFYLLNRPRRQRVLPPRPAHEVALTALNRLRAQGLVEQGRFEEYYVQLSSVVRHYLEDRFQIRAPEMTTEEFLSTLAIDGRLIAPHRRLLGEFLSQADLVKFARHLPSLKDSEGAYDAARRFIEDTRPSVAGASTTEVQHAAA
jgi:hypothetical protein